MTDLFDNGSSPEEGRRPLAERMRPANLDELLGQEKILGPGTPLRHAIELGELPSLLLWGPPGCGKTTLARCLAREVGLSYLPYSAVQVGVKELRAAMENAARMRTMGNPAPLLFLDEIHRFNKAQQDALLPHVEAGDIVLVGATTENPSFEINAALLSRCRLVLLEPLDEGAIQSLLDRAMADEERGLGAIELEVDPAALEAIALHCGGDARFALGSLELAVQHARSRGGKLDLPGVEAILAQAHLLHDKKGEAHFDLISAFHKSLRNSDAQAGVYYLGRMLEGGEDPLYIGRRLVRLASEDVGMADPQALVQANAAVQAVQLIGMPEAALALAQATVYLAQAPKSNALYLGWKEVQKTVRGGGVHPIPPALRNAPTRLMGELGYGKGYLYAHDDPAGVSPMQCLPDSLAGRIFYRPGDRGFEAEAAERLRRAWKLARRKNEGDPS